MLHRASLAGLGPRQGQSPGLKERGTQGQMLWALETSARLGDSAKKHRKCEAEPRTRMQFHRGVQQWDTCLDTAGRTREGSHTMQNSCCRRCQPRSRAQGAHGHHPSPRSFQRWRFQHGQLILCRGCAHTPVPSSLAKTCCVFAEASPLSKTRLL